MRAKFINEKFSEESDPIKDMGIGYSKRTLNSKSFKLLQFIGSKGDEGVGFTEIQYYIWTVLNGYSPESFWEKDDNYNLRKTRGYWGTSLMGSPGGHYGLLHTFCYKNDKGKWVLKRMPKPDEKMYDWSRTYKW